MLVHSEPILLTLLDVMMIIGAIIGLFAIPALLVMRQFAIAGKTTLVVVAGIVANAAVHAAVSLLHL